MRALFAAVAVSLFFSCASVPPPRCVDLSGTWTMTGTAKRVGVGSGLFHIGEDKALREIAKLTILQSDCALRLQAVAPDGATRDTVVEEDDLAWTPEGAAFSWRIKPGTRIIPSVTLQVRTLRLRLTTPDVLTLASELDERGLALMFLPYKEHGEAVAVLERVK